MISRKQTAILLGAFGTLALVSSQALAISVTVDTVANWPAAPQVESYDPVGFNTEWGLGNSGFRPNIYQSFKVASTFTVEEIDIGLRPRNAGGGTYKIYVYAVADTVDVGSTPTLLGSPIYESAPIADFGFEGVQSTVKYDLTGEEFVLPASVGDAGYILRLEAIGASSPMFSVAANTTNPYVDGRGYYVTNSDPDDFAIALLGSAVSNVPEPSTYALGLLGLAGLGLAVWRRRSTIRS
jgi:hypothetical protein